MTFEPQKVRVGVSACLLGEAVRYDGGHKRHTFLAQGLRDLVEWVPVCPEVETGMGVPRESVALFRAGGAVHMRGVSSGEDWTARMRAFATGRLPQLGDLSGYVFKARSPSCGVSSVVITAEDGGVDTARGEGLFTAVLRARMPNLPVVEESAFDHEETRKAFLRRVTAYDRLRRLWRSPWTIPDLEALARDYAPVLAPPSAFGAALHALLGSARALPPAELQERFESLLMRALGEPRA